MSGGLITTLGGVGLFLFGMTLLTSGLKHVTGSSLRQFLTRFTKSPLSGAATGAVTTAIIQSSSATTVMAVGFVSAGLMTFVQALGIVFGANIGTTITGWIVAIIGFKLQLGEAMLPLILIAALMRMFARNHARHAATALAGFAIIFLGIDYLQAGMAAMEGVVTPDRFPDDTVIGRLQLVFIGVAITLVTQSSSASVAATLAALGAGAVTLPQAAAMVIGMDVGTTFTAALATLGASTAARRTGYAHVIFNLMAASLAFMLLSPYAIFLGALESRFGEIDNQFALVGFHSAFNITAVVTILGFTKPFANLVIALVPPSGPALTRGLDEKLLSDPEAAMDAVTGSIHRISENIFQRLAGRLSGEDSQARWRAASGPINDALDQIDQFTDLIKTSEDNAAAHRRHIETLHLLDHLRRLYHRLEQEERIKILSSTPGLRDFTHKLHKSTMQALAAKDNANPEIFDMIRREFRSARNNYRQDVIRAAAQGDIDPDAALLRLDAMRWLHRVAYHVWRLHYHLARAAQISPEPEAAGATFSEDED